MTFAEKTDKFRNRLLGMTESFPDMTEEATKNALIMPFFTILGYDVFDPQEFVPEFVCDVGTKKGEKIDYAIMNNGEPIILIEAKRAGMKLQKQQQGQLYRYFSVNRARIAILTNGLQYNIYSDINSPNVMDDDPFFSFNVLYDDPSVFLPSLEQFCKDGLDIASILSEAVYLKYFSVVEKTFRNDLESPSDELVKYFLTRPEINSGKRITAHTINKYRDVTADALRKLMGVTISSNDTVQAIPEPAENQLSKLSGVAEQLHSALNMPLSLSDIASDLKNADLSANNKKYSIRWAEHKPRFTVTEYADDTYKIHFCRNIDEVSKIINN